MRNETAPKLSADALYTAVATDFSNAGNALGLTQLALLGVNLVALSADIIAKAAGIIFLSGLVFIFANLGLYMRTLFAIRWGNHAARVGAELESLTEELPGFLKDHPGAFNYSIYTVGIGCGAVIGVWVTLMVNPSIFTLTLMSDLDRMQFLTYTLTSILIVDSILIIPAHLIAQSEREKNGKKPILTFKKRT